MMFILRILGPKVAKKKFLILMKTGMPNNLKFRVIGKNHTFVVIQSIARVQQSILVKYLIFALSWQANSVCRKSLCFSIESKFFVHFCIEKFIPTISNIAFLNPWIFGRQN